MDILYIIGPKSKTNHLELRCSLRSIEKFGKNVGNVYVVGYCPKWLSDEVIKLPCEDPYPMSPDLCIKFLNMTYAVLHAYKNSNISDEFLISMDDHFYTRPVDFDNYPYYAKDYLKRECRAMLPTYSQDLDHTEPYTYSLRATRRYLEEKGLPVHNLTIHRNMHCSRKMIEGCMPYFEEILKEKYCVEPYALMLNWLYKQKPFEITPTRDVKIGSASEVGKITPEKTEVFSTTDFYPFTGLWFMLREMYPNKSKYEKKNYLTLL